VLAVPLGIWVVITKGIPKYVGTTPEGVVACPKFEASEALGSFLNSVQSILLL
jgi:hypothetical protein